MATIDADGHVIEPADLWERELPPSLRARGFHIRWDAETEQEQVWVEERLLLPVGIVGVGMAGRPFEDVGKGVRYAELMPVMASQALASGSPGNNPRVPTQDEIVELYKRVYA